MFNHMHKYWIYLKIVSVQGVVTHEHSLLFLSVNDTLS